MQVDDKYMDTMRKTNQLNVTSTGSIYLDGNGAGTVDSLVLAESLCSNCYKDELIRQSEIMKMEAREDAANVCALPMLPNKTSPGGLKDPSSERYDLVELCCVTGTCFTQQSAPTVCYCAFTM